MPRRGLAKPWEMDDAEGQLRERVASYRRFLARGGKPTSQKGTERRAELRQLTEAVREQRRRASVS